MNEPETIKSIFTQIAPRYDLANHILSFGLDFLWRKKLVQLANPLPDEKILDVCCGSGDLAIEFAKKCDGLEITGSDFSEGMIRLAREKSLKKGMNINWVQADCLKTGFDDFSFDIVSCAFGIRNIPEYEKSVQEIYRILKVGGKAAILEFSVPENAILRPFFWMYLHYLLPIIGGIITGYYRHYKYLTSSIKRWHATANLVDILKSAGFGNVAVESFNFGLVKAYIAYKGSKK